MVFQLLAKDMKQPLILNLLENEEEELLYAKPKNMALTALTWVELRLCQLRAVGVLSPQDVDNATE